MIKENPVDENRVKTLIKDLDDDDWQKRESATEELKVILDKTPAVVPYLKEALKSDVVEVKLRAKVILKEFGMEIDK